ncbi:MAG: LysM peptidoglycan-binding domain-containing protein [Planctomycetota bacterium]
MRLQVKIFIVLILILIAFLLIVIDRFASRVNPDKLANPHKLHNFIMKLSEPTKDQVNKIIQKIEEKNEKTSNQNATSDNYLPTTHENDEEMTEQYSKSDKVEIYEVQNGDTFYSLSKRFYGTSKYANELYEYNRSVVTKPENLRIGVKLKIPQKSVLEKKDGKIVRK